jgi:hypothetical protein
MTTQKTHELHCTNGRRLGPYDSHDEAVDAALAEWPDAEIGHDGDLTDGGDRTLIWECEADSTDDDGASAVGSIVLAR